MNKIKILNSKETKKLIEKIRDTYNIKSLRFDCGFFMKEEKIYMVSRELGGFNSNRFNNIGMYFARIANNEIRLSIEGSQIIGKYATKNIISLNDEEIRRWVGGFDVDTIEMLNGFVLIKYKGDFFGSGRIKDGRIINFVPKERRIYNLSYVKEE